MKQCSKCKTEYPATTEYFYRNKQAKDGFQSSCKPCKNKQNGKWRDNNKDYMREYYIENKEKFIYSTFDDEKKDKIRYNNRKYSKSLKGKQSRNRWKSKLGKGVYGIFEKGLCLYVGESSEINKRLTFHNLLTKNPEYAKTEGKILLYKSLQNHPYRIMGILEETENHKEREKYYINKYQPLYNNKI